MFKTSLKQAFRTPLRLAVYFAVMVLVAAFLCIGLNLWDYVVRNLDAIRRSFNVMAEPHFFAELDALGNLYEGKNGESYLGYLPCDAVGYDFSKVEALPGVEKIETRGLFGAFVMMDNPPEYELFRQYCSEKYVGDVIRFVYTGDEPCIVSGREQVSASMSRMGTSYFPCQVTWSAAGLEYAERIFTMSLADITYELEPGKEYILAYRRNGTQTNGGDIDQDVYYCGSGIQVEPTGEQYYTSSLTRVSPIYESLPRVYPYVEGFEDTEAGAMMRQIAQASEMNCYSLVAMTSDDLSMIPSFQSGGNSIYQGRPFTEEEIADGKHVCLISRTAAETFGWKLGDTVHMGFYPIQVPLNDDANQVEARVSRRVLENAVCNIETLESYNFYDFPKDHIFDDGAYEIVGIYGGKLSSIWSSLENSQLRGMRRSEGMNWKTVILPQRSVSNQPPLRANSFMTTIRLNPMEINEFLGEAELSGLGDKTAGEYQVVFYANDHGLHKITPGLKTLQRISNMILLVAGIAAALAIGTVSALHVAQRRREIAVYRAMGIGRGPVLFITLSALLLVCAGGIVIGSLAGQRLSAQVMESILSDSSQHELSDRFSLMANSLSSGAQLTESFRTQTCWLSSAILIGLQLLFSGLLTWRESGKALIQKLGTKE